MVEQAFPYLTKNELTSLSALLAYAAHQQNVSEAIVLEIVKKHFGINDLRQLPRQKFEEAIRFLADVQVMHHLN